MFLLAEFTTVLFYLAAGGLIFSADMEPSTVKLYRETETSGNFYLDFGDATYLWHYDPYSIFQVGVDIQDVKDYLEEYLGKTLDYSTYSRVDFNFTTSENVDVQGTTTRAALAFDFRTFETRAIMQHNVKKLPSGSVNINGWKDHLMELKVVDLPSQQSIQAQGVKRAEVESTPSILRNISQDKLAVAKGRVNDVIRTFSTNSKQFTSQQFREAVLEAIRSA